MLLEGVIALIALATVMVLAPDATKGSPDAIFATGLGHFLSVLGINQSFAISFAMLAFATFVFDTIDVATRLGRYLLQELTGWKSLGGSALATLLTLALPALMLSTTINGPDGKPLPSYLAVWPVFGASNQLLAALSLLGLYAWVQRLTTNFWARLAVGAPMVFMTIMTLWALTLNIYKWIDAIKLGTRTWFDPIGLLSTVLVALALTMLTMTLMQKNKTKLVKEQKEGNLIRHHQS
jgi:carbon starvation protein